MHSIKGLVAPFYKSNDAAHGIDHADDVYELALYTNQKLELGVSDHLIEIAAYYHDIYSTDPTINKNDRRMHNTLAHNYVMQAAEWPFAALTLDERKLVAHAVLEHRASFKGNFYSALSEIISTSDRGKPDAEAIILRSLQYQGGKVDACVNVLNHMVEKFSSTGYAKYPQMYSEVFGDELTVMRECMDTLTLQDVTSICIHHVQVATGA